MSIQSDCESLYISCVEEYVKQNKKDIDEVYKLFQQYHVYEQIMIQHEYLHQVSFDEVMEYIDRIICEKQKAITVYHGTCFDFNQIDLNKSHDRRDFGRGFYTTVLVEQSKTWG